MVLSGRFSSAPTVFSSIILVFVPRNTEEKQQGESVKYIGCKGFGSPRIPSLHLFHQESHSLAQSKEAREAVLLMAFDKLEATVKGLYPGSLLSSVKETQNKVVGT